MLNEKIQKEEKTVKRMNNGPIDQPGRSSDLHSEGREFKSRSVHHFTVYPTWSTLLPRLCKRIFSSAIKSALLKESSLTPSGVTLKA